MSLKAQIRPVEGQDIPFIYSSWLKSYRTSPAARAVPSHLFYSAHHDLIESIFAAPSCEVEISHRPGDPNEILGYIVYQRLLSTLVVHWVYVKQAERGKGVGRELIESAEKDTLERYYTHVTARSRGWASKHGYIFNPYFLYQL